MWKIRPCYCVRYSAVLRFDMDDDVICNVEIIASVSNVDPQVGHFATGAPTDFLLTILDKLVREADRRIPSVSLPLTPVCLIDPFRDVMYANVGLFGDILLCRM